MKKNNESLRCSVLESNSSEDDNASEFRVQENRSIKKLNVNVNHSDDNIYEVQEQCQCQEWDCADESYKDYIQKVEMSRSSSDSRHRSANNDND